MNKPVTIALNALAAIALIGVLSVIFLPMWLGPVIKTAVEQVGPRVTKTAVTLGDVDISLLRGLVQLDRLEIGNPPGFTAPNAVKLDTARVRLDMRSVFSDTLVIDEILVEAPDITFEGFPTSNLSVIQDNVMAAVPAGSPTPVDTKPVTPAAPGSKKFLIKKFSLTNGRVITNVTGRRLPLSLPNILLTDIGKDTGGATPEQAVAAVFSAITRSATGAVTDQTKQTRDTVNKTAESIKKLFK